MTLRIIAAGVLAIGAFSLWSWFSDRPAEQAPIRAVVIGGTEIRVALADTPRERQQGLSGKESLPEGEGLLFVFDTPGKYGFWMKDMHFPIDIIWLDERGTIVHVEKNVAPETYPTVFMPQMQALYVLEISAGFADMRGVSEGGETSFR